MNAGISTNILTATPQDVLNAPASALVLDVRTLSEYESSHIEGAVLHPLTDLDPARIRELSATHASCFLVCRSGGRSRQAYERLSSQGIKNLRVMEGGMQAWEASGAPVVRGRGTISIERQVRISAGSLVAACVALGFLAHPAFFAGAGLIGAGLAIAGITNSCGLANLLAKMPWNSES